MIQCQCKQGYSVGAEPFPLRFSATAWQRGKMMNWIYDNELCLYALLWSQNTTLNGYHYGACVPLKPLPCSVRKRTVPPKRGQWDSIPHKKGHPQLTEPQSDRVLCAMPCRKLTLLMLLPNIFATRSVCSTHRSNMTLDTYGSQPNKLCMEIVIASSCIWQAWLQWVQVLHHLFWYYSSAWPLLRVLQLFVMWILSIMKIWNGTSDEHSLR